MYTDLPVEQLVRRRDTRFQFGFANEARNRVADRGDFVLAASHRGLHVLACHERGLAMPVEALREIYGETLDVAPYRVLFVEGVGAEEPIMNVRLTVEAPFLDRVKGALVRRGAKASEEYLHGDDCVLRFQAPLAELLGLPGELRSLAGGRSEHSIVLSHYALVTRGPGGGMAA